MNALILYVDNLGGIGLHGVTATAPVEGARFDRLSASEAAPAVRKDGRVEEVISIGLKGSGIIDWIRALEETLSIAREGRGEVTLQLETKAGAGLLTSPVYDGWIELQAGGTLDRNLGYQGLKLHLLRADWWAEAQRALKLQNQNGTDVWSGLTIYNHQDSTTGHQNFVDIKASELPGSLRMPASIRLDIGNGPARRIEDVIIAGAAGLWDEYGGLSNVLEGETGYQGTGCTNQSNIGDGGASGGYYRRMEWTSTGEIQLWSWDLLPSRLGYLKGKAYRPVIRLHNLATTAGIYLRWKLARRDLSGAIEQSGQVRVNTGKRMLITPAVNLPLLQLGGGPYETVRLELWAECVTAGTKRLDVDFVQLLPAEEWLHLQSIGGTNEGYVLFVNGEKEQVYTMGRTQANSQAISHVLTGRSIGLQPGKDSRIYFLFETDAGMPVNDTLQVMVYASPRVKTP